MAGTYFKRIEIMYLVVCYNEKKLSLLLLLYFTRFHFYEIFDLILHNKYLKNYFKLNYFKLCFY